MPLLCPFTGKTTEAQRGDTMVPRLHSSLSDSKALIFNDNRIVYAEDGACVWSYLLKVKKIYFSYKEYYHYNKRENSAAQSCEKKDFVFRR